MITVYLHGSLRREAGGPYRVHARHTVGACRLIAAQVPAFDRALRSGGYRVRIGPQGRGGRTLRAGFEKAPLPDHISEIHITPHGNVAIGKKPGMTKLIIGVALLGVGLTGGVALGFGAGIAAGGTTLLSFGSIALTGASTMLMGLAATLSASSQVNRYENREAPEDRPNFLFNGAVNNVQEGGAVSWIWGKDVFIGSSVVSAGIIDEQIGGGNTPPPVFGVIANFGSSATGFVEKGKKAKYRPPEESPDSLQSKSVAHILDLVGEGECELVDGLRSLYLDRTPVQNIDETVNFPGIDVQWRTGTADQAAIAGINDIEIFEGVGSTVTFATPIVASVTDPNTNAARVSVRFPQGLRHVDSSGDIRPTTVQYVIEHRIFGGSYVTDHNVTLSGKAAAGYSASYRVDLEAGGAPWDIRLRRVTADSATLTTTNEIQFASLTRLIEARLRYPYSALAFVRIDSKAFGDDIPKRTYRVRRVDGLVPSNYDPVTGTYEGFWDGSFKPAVNDDPAWGLRDLLTSMRYGCGEDILEEYVDDGALFAISQYCNGLVPDGKGGMERRYTFNGSLTSREAAAQVLAAMAGVFRGMVYWGPGTVVATQDRPKSVSQIVVPANTLLGHVTYEGIGLRHRFNVIKVTWNDPQKLGGTSVTYAMGQESIRKYGRREKDLYAWGASTEGQAYRMGLWELDVARASRLATWGASLKMADLMPGEIVSLADPTISGTNEFGGKIKNFSIGDQTITLDRVLTMDPLQEYSIQITGQEGDLIDRILVNAGGPALTVGITEPLPDPRPIRGADFTITATNLVPQQFQVLANAQTGKLEFGLTAAMHDPDKFDRIELGIVLPPRPTSNIPFIIPEKPINLTVTEYLYQAGSTPQWAAIFGWEAGDNRATRGYEVQYQRADDGEDTWQDLGKPGFSYTRTLQPYAPAAYSFRVRAFSNIGARSDWAQIDVALLGQQAALADVEEFRGSMSGEILSLRWKPVNDLRNPPYQIRYSPLLVGATWSQMNPLVEMVTSSQTNVPAASGTYAIKAKTFYTESTNAIYLIFEDIPSNFNVVAELVENPDWTGAKTNLVVSGADLVYEADTVGAGIYQIENPFDLGDVYPTRLSVAFKTTAFNTDDVMANWIKLVDVATLSNVNPDEIHLTLEVRTTNDDPDASPVWTDWSQMVQGTYVARGYDFRLIVATDNAALDVTITELIITLDMQDRTITGQDIIASPLGTSFTFTPPFLEKPKMFITAQDMESGDYWRITSLTNAAGIITFFDSADVAVSRTFDFAAIGFGKKVT